MANKHRDINPDELLQNAYDYLDECIANSKEHATHSGKIVNVQDRHIPTVGYFRDHWLRQQRKPFWDNMIKSSQWYEAAKDETHPLSDTIKKIRELFDTLATDIVANEGKGIFYAKNRLGMTDKQEISGNKDQPLFGPKE